MPHQTKTAPSGCDISARPELTYLLFEIFNAVGFYAKDSFGLYISSLLVYMSKTPGI